MSNPAVIAVVPAAGHARRLGGAVEGSKEIAEVAGRPVASHVLARLATAGIDRAIVPLRRGKWDVPETLRGTHTAGVELAYVVVDETRSSVHSVVAALPFIGEHQVALAFPDVLFEPADAFAALRRQLTSGDAAIVIGLFPTDTPERVDMVRLDDAGRPVEIAIKQPDRGLRYSWSIAVWRPHFSRFLVDYVTAFDKAPAAGGHELHVGEVVQAAITNDLGVEAVAFPEGGHLDIGTPADLARAAGWMSAMGRS